MFDTQNLRVKNCCQFLKSTLYLFIQFISIRIHITHIIVLCLYFQLIERLAEDYRRASLVAVFIEHIRTDEEISAVSPGLDFYFRKLEAKLFPFLCYIKMAFIRRVPHYHLPLISSQEIIRSLIQVDSGAERHMRDYKILRDLVLMFHSIKHDYSAAFMTVDQR